MIESTNSTPSGLAELESISASYIGTALMKMQPVVVVSTAITLLKVLSAHTISTVPSVTLNFLIFAGSGYDGHKSKLPTKAGNLGEK